MDASDPELIDAYRKGSQEAFAALVRRHLDLVYSAARRQTQSAALAEEVTQAVFLKLSRHATELKPGTPLPAWLYLTTRHAAIDLLRQESRRRAREQAASEIHAMQSAPSPWSQIEPLLDDAMAALPEPDRDAVLHRYLANKSLREVGAALGISDDAAQKRVSRALDQLRSLLAKRGVAVTAAGLATDLSAHAIESAPLALGATISTGAAAAATGLGGASLETTQAIAMTTFSKLALAATLALVIGAAISDALIISRQRKTAAASRETSSIQSPAAPTAPVATAAVPNTPVADSVPQTLTLEGILREKPETLALQLFLVRLNSLPEEQLPKEFTELLALRRAEKGSIGFDEPDDVKHRTGLIYGDPFIRLLLTNWGERAPATALDYVLDPTSNEKSLGLVDRYVDVILAGWSHKEPPAAWNWSLEYARGEAGETGSFGAAFAAVRISAVGDELIKGGHFSVAASVIASKGTPSGSISQNDEYSGFVAIPLVSAWASSDYAAASAWITSLQPPEGRENRTYSDARNNALRGLAEATAPQDIDLMRTMIQQASAPLAKSTLAGGVMNSIASGLNPLEALAWLGNVMNENPGVSCGGAIGNYAIHTRRRVQLGSLPATDEAAIISTIRDPQTKAELLKVLEIRAKNSP